MHFLQKTVVGKIDLAIKKLEDSVIGSTMSPEKKDAAAKKIKSLIEVKNKIASGESPIPELSKIIGICIMMLTALTAFIIFVKKSRAKK